MPGGAAEEPQATLEELIATRVQGLPGRAGQGSRAQACTEAGEDVFEYLLEMIGQAIDVDV